MVQRSYEGIQSQHIELRESHPAFMNVHSMRNLDYEAQIETPAQRSYHEALSISTVEQAFSHHEALFDYLLDWST